MSVVTFPRHHRPHVEVFTVKDRVSDGKMHIFELVGRDEDGPFRMDMAHRFTLDEVVEDVEAWSREGIEVRDTGLFAW